jgi:uncharacterized protein with HEPN domain
MCHRQLLISILQQTEDAVRKILKRFEVVDDVSYFTDTAEGMEKLDAICMLLIAVGESLKNIDKITDKKLLIQYPDIDWKGAKGLRDIITHQYFDIDAEGIFWVCEHHLQPLADRLGSIIRNLQNSDT